MAKIIYLSVKDGTPASSYWDQALITDLLKDSLFDGNNDGGAIVILPGAYQAPYIKEINQELSKLKWVLLIVTSDEESNFPVEKIKHPKIKIYVQYPKRGRHDKYAKFPLGYTSETRKCLQLVDKDVDFFCSGQNTHIRRRECFQALLHKEMGLTHRVMKTEGFAQGLSPEEYHDYMNRTKVAPAPSGIVSQDSFRLYEALEAGAIPIGDNINPSGDDDFWEFLIPNAPFPTINDYSDLSGYIDDQLVDFQAKANRVQSWWIKYKRDLKNQLIDDIAELSGTKYIRSVTVIIPTSTIPSHPSTAILDETVKSVRYHYPDAEIILTFDGLRPEQEERRDSYNEFIRRSLFKANTEWGNVVPIIFEQHSHQIGMARVALAETKTPLILYVEQDTPLVIDEPIEWEKLEDAILSGESNLIRFHFEAFIPKEHEHMMIGSPEKGLLKTVQWSQRPHLASTAFYRRILSDYFSEKSNCFIEDLMHGRVYNDYLQDNIQAWNQWRIHIYYPTGENIKRSYHTDGRAGDKKFDERQIW